MRYSNIFDTHTHSVHSFDGNNLCSQICDGAIKNGGKGIIITDHCDIDGEDFDCEKQYNDVISVKEKYRNRLILLSGIELGQGIFRRKESLEILNKYEYDFVLGSVHNLENMEDFYFLDYSKFDVKALLTDYFKAVLELAKWNMTDSIAHLTYPLRYIVAREHINVDLSQYYYIIDEIFETIIKNDKALELNISGLFMDINDTLPNKALIKRYHDMGGKYVTVGSDSHYSEKVCIGIDRGYDILKECGYDCFTVFEKREPRLIEIK